MITCSSCQNSELEGALFCSNCGARLSHGEGSPPETASYAGNLNQVSRYEGFMPNGQVESLLASQSGVVLQVMSTGDQIPLEGEGEFTLGRVSGSQPILPDIDLTPFQAYEAGVSRLHATILLQKQSTTITDLGSANGTRVNGQRIAAHDPHPLKDGDVLSLGNFKARLLIRGR
ncbi:MAG TPA: FHA domain-containing protein [Anaerolineales bacterium]|nr:FHA domain-containing protein [Anaerolineales bacterium]